MNTSVIMTPRHCAIFNFMFSSQFVTAYLLGCFLAFCFYAVFFFRDRSTSKNQLTPWLLLIFVSLIWPISLASSIAHFIQLTKRLSYFSSTHRQKNQRQKSQPATYWNL